MVAPRPVSRPAPSVAGGEESSIFGMSLDQVHDILSWHVVELDPLRLSLLMQVWRVVFKIGVKALLDGTLDRDVARERDRAAALEKLAAALAARQREGTAPDA
jgi:hypothetical protein